MTRKIVLCVVLAVGLWGCGSDEHATVKKECNGPDLFFYNGNGSVVQISPNDSRCTGGGHG